MSNRSNSHWPLELCNSHISFSCLSEAPVDLTVWRREMFVCQLGSVMGERESRWAGVYSEHVQSHL